jgi:hypothetical protein
VWNAFHRGFNDVCGEIGKGNGAFVELVKALNRGMVEDEEGQKWEVGEVQWFGKEVQMIQMGEARGEKVLLRKLSLR